jgi:hypothetical protein
MEICVDCGLKIPGKPVWDDLYYKPHHKSCFKRVSQATNPPVPQVCSKDLLSADDLEYLERLSDRLTASGFSWQHTDYSRLLCIVPDLVIKLKTSGI